MLNPKTVVSLKRNFCWHDLEPNTGKQLEDHSLGFDGRDRTYWACLPKTHSWTPGQPYNQNGDFSLCMEGQVSIIPLDHWGAGVPEWWIPQEPGCLLALGIHVFIHADESSRTPGGWWVAGPVSKAWIGLRELGSDRVEKIILGGITAAESRSFGHQNSKNLGHHCFQRKLYPKRAHALQIHQKELQTGHAVPFCMMTDDVGYFHSPKGSEWVTHEKLSIQPTQTNRKKALSFTVVPSKIKACLPDEEASSRHSFFLQVTTAFYQTICTQKNTIMQCDSTDPGSWAQRLVWYQASCNREKKTTWKGGCWTWKGQSHMEMVANIDLGPLLILQ